MKVKSKKLIKPLLGILKFEGKIDFIPGQFCSIKIEKDGEAISRPYSIASAPGDELEFYVKASPDGNVAKHILGLEVGDEAEVTKAHGKFNLQDSDKEIYFVCAGSGIAPIMSMARHLKDSDRKQTFLHGASHVDELGYFDELKEMEGDHFKYIPTISRPEENKDWAGETGRVEEHLDKLENSEAEVYICGPPPMVEKVVKALEEKGFSNIFTEKYY